MVAGGATYINIAAATGNTCPDDKPISQYSVTALQEPQAIKTLSDMELKSMLATGLSLNTLASSKTFDIFKKELFSFKENGGFTKLYAALTNLSSHDDVKISESAKALGDTPILTDCNAYDLQGKRKRNVNIYGNHLEKHYSLNKLTQSVENYVIKIKQLDSLIK